MNRRIDLNDVRLLMQVVEHRSFTAAARALGIPKSTISQRIMQLETVAGTGLLRRTSRSLSLTEAGRQLLPHAYAIEDLTRRVETIFTDQDGGLRGTLRISCSQAIAQFALSSVVPRFVAEHNRVTIKVEVNNRLVDIIGEGFDMTVRGHVGPLKDSTLIQRLVAHTRWTCAAAPRWIETNGLPTLPDNLSTRETLCFTLMPDWQNWFFKKSGEERRINVSPRLIFDDMPSLRMSAIAGAGVAYLPHYVLASAIEAGELVELLPDWEAQTSTISVLTPPRLQSSRLAAAFSAFLAAELPKLMRFDRVRAASPSTPT